MALNLWSYLNEQHQKLIDFPLRAKDTPHLEEEFQVGAALTLTNTTLQTKTSRQPGEQIQMGKFTQMHHLT